MNGVLQDVRGGHEHIGRVDVKSVKFFYHLIGVRIKCFDLFDLITKEMNSVGIIGIAGIYIYCVTFYSETAIVKFGFCSRIQRLNQHM